MCIAFSKISFNHPVVFGNILRISIGDFLTGVQYNNPIADFHYQLHHMFDMVLTFEDTGERKPSPVPFRRVLEHFGFEPSEALMVGDWPERDITGAALVGITTVFARYGDTFGTVESGARYDIDDIIEVVKIVDKENGNS